MIFPGSAFAAAIVDHQLLAELAGHRGRKHARQHIGGAARGHGHDYTHRFGGVVLCDRGLCDSNHGNAQQGNEQAHTHLHRRL